MRKAALSAKLPKCGFEGFLVLDEMKIQEDLVIKKHKGSIELVGLVELPEPLKHFEAYKRNTNAQQLASNVLQFVFLGHTGFKFPIANFATTAAKASELYIHVHSVVQKLRFYGFKVTAIIMNGGIQNRDFAKMHFQGNPLDAQWFFAPPYARSSQIAFVQDISHNIKKIRNSLLKSGTATWHSRKITVNGSLACWRHFTDAVHWDRRVNSRPISYRLTDSHLNPNVAEKIRNHLAEEMLDSNMLFLGRKYRESLPRPESLNGVIQLLEVTSKCINIFRDKQPVTDINDAKLQQARDCLQFFVSWSRLEQPQSAKLSREYLEDIQNVLEMFRRLCEEFIQRNPGAAFYTFRFNSDIVENHFGQVRGLKNGWLTPPSYATYLSTINSVILEQKSVSTKSNAKMIKILSQTADVLHGLKGKH